MTNLRWLNHASNLNANEPSRCTSNDCSCLDFHRHPFLNFFSLVFIDFESLDLLKQLLR